MYALSQDSAESLDETLNHRSCATKLRFLDTIDVHQRRQPEADGLLMRTPDAPGLLRRVLITQVFNHAQIAHFRTGVPPRFLVPVIRLRVAPTHVSAASDL